VILAKENEKKEMETKKKGEKKRKTEGKSWFAIGCRKWEREMEKTHLF